MLQSTDLRVIDGANEPRVHDIRLAEALDFERSRVIRELIERNVVELERYGGLPCHTANHGVQGGRPGREYWLNEAQALLICIKSEAPRAADVREEIIKVFLAWRHGHLVPASPITLDAVGNLFDRKLEPVHRGMTEIRGDIAEVRGNVVFLSERVGHIEMRVEDMAPRHDFTRWTQRQWGYVIVKRYGCYCPCCRKNAVVNNDGHKLGVAHADHFNGRERNRPDDGWLVCGKCNYQLAHEAAYKEFARAHFRVFQDNRSDLFGNATKQSPRRSRKLKMLRDKRQGDLF